MTTLIMCGVLQEKGDPRTHIHVEVEIEDPATIEAIRTAGLKNWQLYIKEKEE